MRHIRRIVFGLAVISVALVDPGRAGAAPMDQAFTSIEGDKLEMGQWAGQPILVVNTASRCGFTPQYKELQALYEKYRDRGLVVLGVPSDDFRQELSSAEEVKEFCELTYGIDFPMTDIAHVKGPDAHPFFKDVQAETGFVPRWNFNKVLIGRDGRVVETWGAGTRPSSLAITRAIEAQLNG